MSRVHSRARMADSTAPSIASAMSGTPRCFTIIAALKIAPTGFTRPCPAMSGAVPWTGSKRLRLVSGLMFAEGAMPMPPTNSAVRSERMSPNRLPVTRTSNWLGSLTSCIAHASTRRCRVFILGCAAATDFQRSCQSPPAKVMAFDLSTITTSRFAGGLWQERWKSVAAAHPRMKTRHLLVDACAMQLVKDPSQFDVLVTGNLFGDILSDLTAELVGGMGIAPSANINPETRRGLFEAVHGTARDIAGQGLVNPVGAILSAAMMVKHLGVPDMADALEGAVESAIRARECTRDIGGDLSTSQAGDAIVKRLRD